MELKEMIYRRKSNRSYTGVPVEEGTLQKIRDFSASLKLLYPQIRVRAEIIDSEYVRCILPWTTPQVLAIFSEESDGALENVGFLYQQVDLYIQSLGLGSCWLGMGRLDPKGNELLSDRDGMKFVMMIAFGYPKGKAQREDMASFKRKSLGEISDREDQLLEPARLAPSSVNSQPWYFTHEGDMIHVYCAFSGLFRKRHLSDMNRIDIGIALAHLYLEHPDTYRFFQVDHPTAIKNYRYIGTITI